MYKFYINIQKIGEQPYGRTVLARGTGNPSYTMQKSRGLLHGILLSYLGV